jgi:hypothetical protein
MTTKKLIPIKFTDNMLAKWKASGIEQEHIDGVAHGLRVLVSSKGRVRFILYAPLEKGRPSSRHKAGGVARAHVSRRQSEGSRLEGQDRPRAESKG